MRTISIISLLAFCSYASARILSVPAEYLRIQEAIDISENGDTILVEAGLYAEALQTNERSLVIIGTSAPDTLENTGVIIDPTSLDSSNALSCLTIFGGDSVNLKNLWFRNGEAMHVGRALNDPGGIDNSHGLRKLELASCRFDSVYACIRHGVVIKLDSVVMHNAQLRCVSPGDSGQIIAKDCRFHGRMDGIAVWGRSGSSFSRCTFSNSGTGYLLAASSDRITVLDCDFGPFRNDCGLGIVINAGIGTRIENSIFHDIETGAVGLRVSQYSCSTITNPEYQHPIIRNNVFENFQSGVSCQYGTALQLHCDGIDAAFLGVVANNTFSNIESRGFYGIAINIEEGSAHLIGNRFENLRPDSTGAIFVHRVESPETLMMRTNTFDDVQYAVQHSTGDEETDARWNWWGDSTGPYSSSENPNGLGAEVDWGVQFVPWLTMHPDSSIDTNEIAVDEQPALSPREYSLSAYPNPFNATTTLQIEVARAGEYEVVLFNLLGRQVATLFTGRIETVRSLQVRAESLASGLYLARLSGNHGALATKKLLLLK